MFLPDSNQFKIGDKQIIFIKYLLLAYYGTLKSINLSVISNFYPYKTDDIPLNQPPYIWELKIQWSLQIAAWWCTTKQPTPNRINFDSWPRGQRYSIRVNSALSKLISSTQYLRGHSHGHKLVIYNMLLIDDNMLIYKCFVDGLTLQYGCFRIKTFRQARSVGDYIVDSQ